MGRIPPGSHNYAVLPPAGRACPLLGAADLQNRKLLLLRPASRFALRGTDAGRSGPVATDKCDCEIGRACRRQREEREIIAGLFAEFEPDTLRLLEATADMVRKDYIKGGTAIKLAENVTAKFKIKDGTVIVTRSEKHEHQHSL